MTETNLYNIVCMADDLYAMHAGVMIESLLNFSSQYCNIFLITNNMQESNKKRIYDTVSKHKGSNITIIQVDNKKFNLDKYSTGNGVKFWNNIMYLKLFLPKILPKYIDKVLYLDVDIVVNSDIKDLYNIDFDNTIIAGAEDWKYCYLHKKRIGLKEDECYINSGVMMINLDEWRNFESIKPMDEFMLGNKDRIINDQDVFALYFRNRIKYIHQKWNVTTYYFERKPRVSNKYLAILKDIRKAPNIIHFCEPIKPWYKECKHPYRILYKYHKKNTPWKDVPLKSCKTHFGKPSWRYVVKHWLNVLNLRKDDWYMVRMKK